MQHNTQEPYLLVDSSYLTYSRFFSTLTWYSKNHPIDDIPYNYDWSINETFMERYRNNYLVNIWKIMERYGITTKNIFIIRDCPREEIWRKDDYNGYKATRKNECSFQDKKYTIGNLFRYTYREIYPLIESENQIKILKYDRLEADDIIAFMTTQIKSNYPTKLVVILTNDNDFLQLKDKNTMIWNTHDKLINNRSNFTGAQSLLKKIIEGDVSDNIPACCDEIELKQNLMEWIYNPTALHNHLLTDADFAQQFRINKKLIDFNEVPEQYTAKLLEFCHEHIGNLDSNNFLDFIKRFRDYRREK